VFNEPTVANGLAVKGKEILTVYRAKNNNSSSAK
jgi:hypothetical protein